MVPFAVEQTGTQVFNMFLFPVINRTRQLIWKKQKTGTENNMSEKVLPKPGSHVGRRTGAIVVYESDSGALCAAIPFMLLSSDVAFSGKHTLTLGKSDGTEQTKTIENLQKVFAKVGLEWDGNPFTLPDVPMLEEGKPEFNLDDCYIDDSYTPPNATAPVLQFKVQWLNPLGGGMMPTQTKEEFEALKSKWLGAGKFGAKRPTATAPAKSAEEKKPEATPAAPKERKAPTRKTETAAAPKFARKSSALDVMNLICKRFGQGDQTSDEVQADLANKYYWPGQAAINNGSDLPESASPEEWGKVADWVESQPVS